MIEAAEGHLTTEALNWNHDNQKLFLEWFTFSFVAILILPLLNAFRELKRVEDYRKRINAELLKNGRNGWRAYICTEYPRVNQK